MLEQIKLQSSLTPGQFSVGYRVKSVSGKEGFLKASDIGMLLGSQDPVQKLLDATTAHQFERSVLEHCRGNRLDKIVTAIDSGTHQIDVDGVRDFVFFIVFELASGDLRKYVASDQGNDLLWVVSAIHNLSVAVSQMHSANIYHNDFKPGNALVFEDTEKVADLGRATSPQFPVSHENMLCAGDSRFAPPEQLYFNDNGSLAIDKFIRFKAGDLYNLGSVMHFLVTKRMLTPEVIVRLDDAFKPPRYHGGWNDSLNDVMPYWRQAFNVVITEFYDDLPNSWLYKYRFCLDEIKDIILHLCEPDILSRGDLKATEASLSKYSLERIISKLANLKNRLLVKSRA